jgi:hypothetical protein
MTAWTSDELTKIGEAEELRLASLRSDGTLRNPVIVWVVRTGDDLYVRSMNGRSAAWFRGTETRHEGRVWAGGLEKDVTFVPVNPDDEVNDQIDEGYRSKYGAYAASIINHMLTPDVKAATIQLVPRTAMR